MSANAPNENPGNRDRAKDGTEAWNAEGRFMQSDQDIDTAFTEADVDAGDVDQGDGSTRDLDETVPDTTKRPLD